jgi:hypothetical protein
MPQLPFLTPLRRLGAIAAMLVTAALPAKAVPVGLELSLLVDVSGSVSSEEYALQRTGYVQAFQSAAVQNAILSSVGGAIAVNFIQWASAGQQQQSIGWTLIDSVASANAFASVINGVTRAFSGSTAPGSAINFAVPLFNSNGFEGARNVIDVSGDGEQNDGSSTLAARNAALAAGITTINGIVIGGDPGVATFYQNNIVGGAGGFLELANSFNDFGDAIQRKLVREITPTPVPEPASLVILGAGLMALGAVRRRRRAA